ncbi:class I SAM-dependent methyltransferase [Glaciimonas soli]|uniref:Methyltransferase domain-containing protein n=1 Tax=Glaciimonas soli TaxID=2590999 RepID=A0A843YV58_9BURK|nr:class I SAM-dependent methyltransferase [Glaciimonas soli]MQR01563.1 methyltransferase domain-containing protein [Glaciimonas soli]
MLKIDMAEYYAKRAAVYEDIYSAAERQDDLLTLQVRVQEILEGHDVLEVGCGTGFWTEQIAATANSVLATDVNPEMMKLAQAKNFPADKVQFAIADVFNLQFDPQPAQPFTAVFLGFLWSHIGRQDQSKLLAHLREKLGADILLVMIDNSYVDGSSTVIARTDEYGNTYQHRRLPGQPNGDRYEIMKNFPTDSNLRKRLAPDTRDLRILRLEYYWMLNCKLK